MNKDFLQRAFNSKSGQVYAYTGTIPNGVSVPVHVTEQFVSATGNNLLNTVVIPLPQFGSTVIYVDSDSMTVNSEEFVFLTDLIPDPEPEVVPPAEGE